MYNISLSQLDLSTYLCDGVSQLADNHGPHSPQMFFSLQRLSTNIDGSQHCLSKRQRTGVA